MTEERKGMKLTHDASQTLMHLSDTSSVGKSPCFSALVSTCPLFVSDLGVLTTGSVPGQGTSSAEAPVRWH